MKLSIKKVRYSIFSHCDFNVEYKSNNLLIVEINSHLDHGSVEFNLRSSTNSRN